MSSGDSLHMFSISIKSETTELVWSNAQSSHVTGWSSHLSVYRGLSTRNVYLYYMSCLKYPILVGNPRYRSMINLFTKITSDKVWKRRILWVRIKLFYMHNVNQLYSHLEITTSPLWIASQHDSLTMSPKMLWKCTHYGSLAELFCRQIKKKKKKIKVICHISHIVFLMR